MRTLRPKASPAFALTLLAALILSSIGARGEDAPPPNDTTQTFASRLVDAARAQISVPTLYDPTYRKIPYPAGDVPWYIGVCTDVIVRAYRALGIDLQELVHTSNVGSGDRNIDHRRVTVLGKFFARRGVSLPMTQNPEDYHPGDLVTYYVPDGTFSKTHIAIVSNRENINGVPLVIHNRGYGVQEEDWLFADKITGHYRFQTEPHMEKKAEGN